ncbi:MAG: hypothetical protein IJ761_00290 [Bacteroidales bacterium]|nr:hypothetical protein [Bacteroidales bacterium]
MNISRENLSDLELCVKIDIEEKDYGETVTKQLKDYQKKAVVPGFRKGNAPMDLIKRMYKSAVVSDAVQNTLNSSLFKYIDDEKLNILGMPMSNDEKTGQIDFDKQNTFTFYFDMALAPEFDIDWNNVGIKYNQIKVTAKDVDNELNEMTTRHGKFEAPETVNAGDTIYGKLVELGKDQQPKEDGLTTFASFNLKNIKDEELVSIFEGKKNEDKVVFNVAKTFPTADIERALRMDTATAKKFKSDVELTISGISRIIPHAIDEELFKLVFPEEKIADEKAFRKALHTEIEKANDLQSDYLFVNQVRKSLVDNFTATLPEAFLKRWFASRGEKDLTMETIEARWESEYLPSLKWELIESKLEKIQPIEPTQNQIVDYIKSVLRTNDRAVEGETDEQKEQRLENSARSIAADRQNIRGIIDRLYAENLAKVLKEQIKPETVKVSVKEFEELAKA